MKFAFWFLNLIPLIVFGIRIYFWVDKNPSHLFSDPSRYTKQLGMKGAYFFMDSFAMFNFCLIYFTSLWLFATYKLQENAYMVLPSLDDIDGVYEAFNILFFIVTIFQLLAVVLRVIEQCSFDIFLIDWEKPSIEENETISQNQEDDEAKEYSIKKPRVVAWRSIFVANEFNELQSGYRYISPETTLIWLCFFLRAVQWEDWAASDPDRTFSPSKHTPQNYILLFFIVSSLLLVIGAV